MGQMQSYIGSRLSEHSTQVALAADVATIGMFLQDKVSLSTAITAIVGSLVAILFPSK